MHAAPVRNAYQVTVGKSERKRSPRTPRPIYDDTIRIRRSKWPRGLRRRSAAARPAETVGSNPTGGHGCLSVVSVVCVVR